jgi:Ca-activated chloride channel family protein
MARPRTIAGIATVTVAVLLLPISLVWAGWLRPAHTLRIVAGSELQDVLGNTDLVERLRRATGVRLEPTYTGTLKGVQAVLDTLEAPTAAGSFDLAWFSSPAYLRLVTDQPGVPKLPKQDFTPTMRSPVVVGVRQQTANDLQWLPGRPVTWKDVVEAAGAGRFTFAATDAAASNSGLSALVSVATAFDMTPGTPLGTEDIDKPQLTRFLSGRTLKAESSRPLTDAFCSGNRAQALVSYESEVLAASTRSNCGGELRVVYPEGVVNADYALVQVKESARADAEAVRGWLLSREGQEQLAKASFRRLIRGDVARSPVIPNQEPRTVELPGLETLRQLLGDYLDVLQRPARTVYVLDVSLSMRGDRINELRSAFCALTGRDPTVISQFTRFRSNERVTVIPFATTPRDSTEFIAEGDTPNFGAACDFVRGLELGPGVTTSVYSALQKAYETLDDPLTRDEGYCPAIIMMTDGDSNDGLPADKLAPGPAPIFAVRFGDAQAAPLEELAARTNGRWFDANETSLRDVFEETRAVGC